MFARDCSPKAASLAGGDFVALWLLRLALLLVGCCAFIIFNFYGDKELAHVRDILRIMKHFAGADVAPYGEVFDINP
jgi:hypothetical protein